MYDPAKCTNCGGKKKPLFTSYYCDLCDRPKSLRVSGLLPLDRFSNSTTYLGGYASGDPRGIMDPKTKWDLFKYIARICYLMTETGGAPIDSLGPLGGSPATILAAVAPMGSIPPITLGRDIEAFLDNIPYFKKLMIGTMTQAGNTVGHGTHKINFLNNFNLVSCDDANAVMYASKAISIITYGKVALPGYLVQTVSNTRDLLTKKGWNCIAWDVVWNVTI